MAVELSEPRSRRALLAAAAGAAVATVASALGRPSPVNAATGYFDSASAGTAAVRGLNTAASGYPAFGVDGESASTDGIAVRGQALASTGETCGVFGQTQSTSGRGVIGQAFAATGDTHGVLGQSQSTSGMGVSGYATAATGDTFGVRGSSESTSGTGVCGNAVANSTGVMGISGIQAHASSPKTGVYGYAAQDIAARGVYGETTVGQGVRGVATSGYGVRGVVTSGTGASGYATTGTAVLATSANPKVGTALRAVGRVRFDNSVGLATVAAGTSSITVTPGIDLTATSAVVATLQGDAGGGTTVKRVTVNATADTFTIYLTANAAAAVKVAWHVFG